MFTGVQVEKGEVEKKVKTSYEVKVTKITFTQEDLDDPTPTTFTKRELFNWMGGNATQG